MIARLIVHIRYLRAWWVWFMAPQGDFRLDDERFAEDTAALKSYDARVAARHPSPRECPSFDCVVCLALHPDPLLTVSSLDPMLVGRQAVEGDAITDIAAWLAASGFADMDRGELQRYACWIRNARAAYEQIGAMPS